MSHAQRLRGDLEKDVLLLKDARSRGWLIRSDSPKVTNSDSGDRQKGDFSYYWSKLRHGSIETEPPGSNLKSYFNNQNFSFSPIDIQESSAISISATGDIMFQKNIGSDTANLYGDAGKFLFSADFVTGNLEAPLDFSKRNRGFPRFNINKTMFEKLSSDGFGRKFDLFATANNHLLDGGVEGVIRTKKILDSCGIRSVGTARSREEQDQFPIVDINSLSDL